jgi:DNA-binding CsgD family transcriptional regulator
MRLLSKDFDRLQHAILALHECRTVTALKKALPTILLSLVPADLFYLMEFENSPKAEQMKVVALIDPARQIKPEQIHYIEGALLAHPIPKYFMQTGDNTALKLSDFYTTTRRLEASEFYERFYHPIGVRRKITVPVAATARSLGAIGLCGNGKDFTERDRLMLNLIRPHIDLARRNAERLADERLKRAQSLTDYGLTRREEEIARWLAIGKTNAEMAVILAANVRTVEKHVEVILKKLGVENRTAASVLIAASRRNASPA